MVYTNRNSYLLIRKYFQMLAGVSSVPAVLVNSLTRKIDVSRQTFVENNNATDEESMSVYDDSMTHAHVYPAVDDRQLIHDRFARLTENMTAEQMQRLLLQLEVLMTHHCSRENSELHEPRAVQKIDVSEV